MDWPLDSLLLLNPAFEKVDILLLINDGHPDPGFEKVDLRQLPEFVFPTRQISASVEHER